MHCWCPPATGPGQPHESTCVQYKRPVKYKHLGIVFGHGTPYKATAHSWNQQAEYHPVPTETLKTFGFEWSETHDPTLSKEAVHKVYAGLQKYPLNVYACTCAAKSGVISHAKFCPLGVGPDQDNPPDADAPPDDPGPYQYPSDLAAKF
jgi:hypothetical protein